MVSFPLQAADDGIKGSGSDVLLLLDMMPGALFPRHLPYIQNTTSACTTIVLLPCLYWLSASVASPGVQLSSGRLSSAVLFWLSSGVLTATL